MSGKLWQVVGRRVQGAAHRSLEQPCQDALVMDRGARGAVLAALADGHGSAQCYRSDRGAELACRAARELLEEVSQAPGEQLEELLPGWKRRLLVRWQELVEKELTAEEQLSPHRYLPFGATLIAVCATPDFVTVLQLGDGDVLVCQGGQVGAVPELQPEKLLGNETYSLCQSDAEKQLRHKVFRHLEVPEMMMLATDGYSNSFANQQAFELAAQDFHALLSQPGGLEEVEMGLEGWLQDTSEGGSGDDITLVLIAR